MEESTCHEMVICLSQIFSSMLCVFFHFYISSKYDVHIDAERMIIKTQECKVISASMV